MEKAKYSGYEKPLNLSEQRLLVSTGLGNEFKKLLEAETLELNTQEQEELQKILNELKVSKLDRQIVRTSSERVVAALLREYDPEMIIGSKGGNLKDALKQIASQLGLPEPLSTVEDVSSRLVGRQNVAVVVMNNTEEGKVEKSFKKIPDNGILVFCR